LQTTAIIPSKIFQIEVNHALLQPGTAPPSQWVIAPEDAMDLDHPAHPYEPIEHEVIIRPNEERGMRFDWDQYGALAGRAPQAEWLTEEE